MLHYVQELANWRTEEAEWMNEWNSYQLKVVRCFKRVIQFIFPKFSFKWITVNGKEQYQMKINTAKETLKTCHLNSFTKTNKRTASCQKSQPALSTGSLVSK